MSLIWDHESHSARIPCFNWHTQHIHSVPVSEQSIWTYSVLAVLWKWGDRSTLDVPVGSAKCGIKYEMPGYDTQFRSRTPLLRSSYFKFNNKTMYLRISLNSRVVVSSRLLIGYVYQSFRTIYRSAAQSDCVVYAFGQWLARLLQQMTSLTKIVQS